MAVLEPVLGTQCNCTHSYRYHILQASKKLQQVTYPDSAVQTSKQTIALCGLTVCKIACKNYTLACFDLHASADLFCLPGDRLGQAVRHCYLQRYSSTTACLPTLYVLLATSQPRQKSSASDYSSSCNRQHISHKSDQTSFRHSTILKDSLLQTKLPLSHARPATF